MKIILVLTAILSSSVFQISTIQVAFSLGAELGRPVWGLIRSLFLTKCLPGLLENCSSLVYRGAEYAEGFFFFSFALVPFVNCFYSCFSVVVLLHYSGIVAVPPAFWYTWKHEGAALLLPGCTLVGWHLPGEGRRAGRVVDPRLPTRLVCGELQFPSGTRVEAVLGTGLIVIFFAGCAARLEYQCRFEGEHLSFEFPTAPHSLKLRKANGKAGVQSCKGVGLVGFDIPWILCFDPAAEGFHTSNISEETLQFSK